jgi:hypothetical protein
MVKKIIIFFLLFFITACFPSTHRGLNQLQLNDSKTTVIKVMGKPSSTSILYDREVMVYYVHEDFADLIFAKKFPFIGFYPLVRTGKKYWIVLQDNRLVAFGEASDKRVLLGGK